MPQIKLRLECTSYLTPHGGLLVGSQGVNMANDVHAMLGSRQHDIDTVRCPQEANLPLPVSTECTLAGMNQRA